MTFFERTSDQALDIRFLQGTEWPTELAELRQELLAADVSVSPDYPKLNNAGDGYLDASEFKIFLSKFYKDPDLAEAAMRKQVRYLMLTQLSPEQRVAALQLEQHMAVFANEQQGLQVALQEAAANFSPLKSTMNVLSPGYWLGDRTAKEDIKLQGSRRAFLLHQLNNVMLAGIVAKEDWAIKLDYEQALSKLQENMKQLVSPDSITNMAQQLRVVELSNILKEPNLELRFDQLLHFAEREMQQGREWTNTEFYNWVKPIYNNYFARSLLDTIAKSAPLESQRNKADGLLKASRGSGDFGNAVWETVTFGEPKYWPVEQEQQLSTQMTEFGAQYLFWRFVVPPVAKGVFKLPGLAWGGMKKTWRWAFGSSEAAALTAAETAVVKLSRTDRLINWFKNRNSSTVQSVGRGMEQIKKSGFWSKYFFPGTAAFLGTWSGEYSEATQVTGELGYLGNILDIETSPIFLEDKKFLVEKQPWKEAVKTYNRMHLKFKTPLTNALIDAKLYQCEDEKCSEPKNVIGSVGELAHEFFQCDLYHCTGLFLQPAPYFKMVFGFADGRELSTDVIKWDDGMKDIKDPMWRMFNLAM